MTSAAFRTLRILSVFLLLVLSQTDLLRAQPAPVKDGEKLDAVVAVVGKYPIFKSSIDAQTQAFLLQRGVTSMSPDSMMVLRNQILQSEIDLKTLLAKADQDSVTITENDVDDQLDAQIKSYVSRLGSEEAVEKAFGRSIAELKASPDLRQRTRENLIAQRERFKAVPAPTTIARQDVEEFYHLYKDSLPQVGAQVELATIVKLVKPLPNQKERSKAFAESLVDSIRHGSDFANLARRYSQDKTASGGGDLGAYFPRGTFLPAFEEAAFKLKPGEVSNVVETEQGFHIIKLIDRRGEEIHVAQILIKPTVNSLDEEAVRDTLLQIRDKALHGEDFGKLAQEYSDDPETKAFGGSLGRIRAEDLAPEQKEVVDSLQEGEISRPLHIGYPGGKTGFQIVKLVKKVPAHTVSLEEDYRDLEATAENWKASKDFAAWLAKARTTVYMQVHDLASYY